MVTRLDDATIKVVLDVEGAKRDADRLEQDLREREERRERERREEREKKERGGRGGSGGGRGGGGNPLRTSLATLISRIPRSLPFFIGTGFAIAYGTAELTERYGPYFQGLIEGILKEKYPNLEIVGGGSDQSAAISSMKAFFNSFEKGFEKAKAAELAKIIAGGGVSSGRFMEEFAFQKRLAQAFEEFDKAKRRRELEMLGSGTGQYLRRQMREALADGDLLGGGFGAR